MVLFEGESNVSTWPCRAIGLDETYWLIREKMMNIVATLPPADGQAAAEISNEHAN
jgi:hypothetical protein